MPIGNLGDLENFQVGNPTYSVGVAPTYADNFNSRFGNIPGTQTTQKGVATPITGKPPILDPNSLGTEFGVTPGMQMPGSAGVGSGFGTAGAAVGNATDSLFNFFNQYVGRAAVIVVGLVFLFGGFHMFAPNIVRIPHP